MTSLTQIALGGLGIARASILPLAFATSLHLSAAAQAGSQPQPQKGAAALGKTLTPSNSALFQAPQAERKRKAAPNTLKVDRTNQVKENDQAPLEWQSEHLDNQRRSSGGFSVFDID
jgi:hypothetical protein